MTTERINLDRIITREVTTTSGGGLALRYATRQSNGDPGDGEYRRVSSTTLLIGGTDSDGVSIPDAISPMSILIHGYTGFSSTGFDDLFDATEIVSFTKQVAGHWQLVTSTFAFITEPDGLNPITVTLGSSTETTETVEYWARREDFPAADFTSSTDTSRITVLDSRYVVRSSPVWKTTEFFTDEDGNRRRIDGISQLGRRKYLELFARRIGVA